MTEEIKNNIDELDGMVKIKGKCGYEIIGGCRELRELKQENKANEKQIELDVEHICRLNEQIEKLEQENKKLKKDVQLFKCLDTFGESECHCACRCLGNEFCEDAEIKINKYKTALEEIRDYLNTLSSVDNDFPNTETYLRIQDKTKEVLND